MSATIWADRRWTTPGKGSRSTLATSAMHNGAGASSVDGAAKLQLTGDRVGSDPDGCGWSTRPDFLDCPTAAAGDGPRTSDRVSSTSRRLSDAIERPGSDVVQICREQSRVVVQHPHR
jgi:hypothetical protein